MTETDLQNLRTTILVVIAGYVASKGLITADEARAFVLRETGIELT